MTFVYQAINVVGWLEWTREQRLRPVLEGAQA
jgi:hypothetical protein